MPRKRPSVFVGSSSEGLKVAEAIQVNLDRSCEVVLWSQGIFGLGTGNLESLVDSLDDFDFAVLVLSPDDLTTSRGTPKQSPRDNILLEMGLFIGHLGRDRTFAVYDRTANLKLPSDLAGVTNADYELHSSGNLEASLGAPCIRIAKQIAALGIRPNYIDVRAAAQNMFATVLDCLLREAKLPMFFVSNQLDRILACNQMIADLLTTTQERLKKESAAWLVERVVSLAPLDSQSVLRQHQTEMADRFLAGDADYDSEATHLDCRKHPFTNPFHGQWKVRIHAHRVTHENNQMGFFVYYMLDKYDHDC